MFRKNTAGQFIHFQGVDSATGGIKSAVTWTVRRCIDGTFAAATGTVTEDGTTGWYKLALSQADTNGNNIGFNFTGTGAIPQTVTIVTTDLNPYDAVRAGLTALPNANAAAAGGLWILGANAAATTTLTGVAAAGATPATPALSLTGGAASITGGGVAAQALLATGGAGAASTNGAAGGVKFVGGGTNTVASSAHGLETTGTSTGSGLGATSGAGATGNGITSTAASTNGSGMTLVSTGSGKDLNATTTPLVLAKTTNITGFNDIAATAVVSAGAITTSGGAVSTVTNTTQLNGAATVVLTDASSDAVIADAVWNAATVTYGAAGSYGLLIETDLDATISSRLATAGYTAPTNLTAAQIATGVWQDATAGDFTTASSIGKSLYTSGVVPGAAGGLFIAGTNAATTVTTALTTTFTGNLTGSVASVTGAVGSVTGAVGSVTGAVGSVTGLTASDVGAIKTKTDSLNFTVAGQVDANIQYVNDVVVTGTGAAGSEWGP